MQIKPLRDQLSFFRLKKKKKGSNIANENELQTTIENDIILPETV